MQKLNLSTNGMQQSNSEYAKKAAEWLEYVDSALSFLETMTRVKWTSQQERALFLARLAKYPKWKFDHLEHYTGSMSNQLFKFLDDIQPETENVRQALGYDPYVRQLTEGKSSIAHDVRLHIDSLNAVEFRPTVNHEDDAAEYQNQREQFLIRSRKVEREGLIKLHEKYPHLGFENILSAPRFA